VIPNPEPVVPYFDLLVPTFLPVDAAQAPDVARAP